MRFKELSENEYLKRITKIQQELKNNKIDILICYGSECESGVIRYFNGFWPFFDFASLIIPSEGDAVLVTGGPESFDFAKSFSKIKNIKINHLLVETSAPEWIREETEEGFNSIIKSVYKYPLRRIGISNWNIFPHILFEDLKKLPNNPEFIPADDLILRTQSIKTAAEIPYIIEAYRITEEAMIETLNKTKAGMREWELEAIAKSKMLNLGAEGMPYPAWVCSGKNTRLSLCRSTDKVIKEKELIQFTFGAKFMGYCGNMCRPFSIGIPSKKEFRLMNIGKEAIDYAFSAIKPGLKASDIFNGYYKILSKYNLEEFALYGPAHGTGSSEVESLWLSRNANFIIQPNMVFNIDIWLSDGIYGLRYEDGIIITENGVKQLTSYKREVIIL